jgi:hypothetical protein
MAAFWSLNMEEEDTYIPAIHGLESFLLAFPEPIEFL